MAEGVCIGSGWGSQICADYVAWAGATLDWAIGICGGGGAQAGIRSKPQIIVAEYSGRREILE